MADRELLELAAKAGEVGILWWTKDGKKLFVRNGGFQTPWNPLEHDGDALRLAVKLGLFIDAYSTTTTVGRVVDPLSLAVVTLEEKHDNEPFAATRRAIVRAAAEIGRTK